ncbi:hypothetical protein N657DRAFT_642923 [Parathielavia appendiculata]|uniref:Uncharacterized protein n=1 Tax=Parathielavia appendiculata TaxID=2587402 RepID=A0AAN6U4J8_9PEZI|nr:hypothetical protein N657DRAFT_642923 [Parathielavia appendiculata]
MQDDRSRMCRVIRQLFRRLLWAWLILKQVYFWVTLVSIHTSEDRSVRWGARCYMDCIASFSQDPVTAEAAARRASKRAASCWQTPAA